MEWLDQITTLLGVNPVAFLALTVLVIVALAVVRAFAKKLETKDWWKAVLTGSALALGVGGAYLFQAAGLYKLGNPFLVAVAGLFNGTLAVTGQQLLKKIPWVGKWLKAVVPLIAIVLLAG